MNGEIRLVAIIDGAVRHLLDERRRGHEREQVVGEERAGNETDDDGDHGSQQPSRNSTRCEISVPSASASGSRGLRLMWAVRVGRWIRGGGGRGVGQAL